LEWRRQPLHPADKSEYKRGYRFSTCATWWIQILLLRGRPQQLRDVETLIRTKMTARPSDAADRAGLESLREGSGR